MFEILEKITASEQEYALLIESIRSKNIKCSNMVDVDGDYRFWNVDTSSFNCLKEFYILANDTYKKKVGKLPLHCYLMINHISADRTLFGSGGGWHVDSVRKQYKTFMYLTDCESADMGPLTLLSSGSVLRDKFSILLNYFKGNKFRFSESKVAKMKSSSFREMPMLFKKLIPFFVDTSFIHRGLPITKGERIMVTAYMFDGEVPESIQKRLNK